MILSLHIENVAVVKKLDIDLRGGFNVLSGETGAGKSIIIDCLNLLSGARADKELIRAGESAAEVSALFGNVGGEVKDILSSMGLSADDETLMISRTIYSDMPSQARINGRSVTVSMLRDLASVLFNIHGQNDNQRLLDKQNHIDILDSYAACKEAVAEYHSLYSEILRIRAQIKAINKDSSENNRLRDILKYQIDEINALKLREGEEEALVAESKRLQSIEQIEKNCKLVDRALNGGEKGVGALYLIERAETALAQLSDALPEAEALSKRLTDVRYEIDDVASTVSGFGNYTADEPSARIDKIEGRLDAISRLKKKYGATFEEIMSFRDDAQKRLDVIENFEERISELEGELSGVCERARDKARDIRNYRIKAAKALTARVTETLAFLDMPKITFRVLIEDTEDFGPSGLDRVEFMVSANPGEPVMPLVKIASGGELARIMLALKDALNESDGIETAVFDEVDTGISGKTSRKVGIKLREISDRTQVICVTHSAQIASLATAHFRISKEEVDGRSQTFVFELDREGRVEEIARILGGIEISDTQRRAAKEMIEEGIV